MDTSFPFNVTTVGGTQAVIFAYVLGQARPWIGAYLFDKEVDGMEYIPMSWIGSGRFNADFQRPLDIVELAEMEAALIEEVARQREDNGESGLT